VFVQTQGAIDDGADARLYSWDSDSKQFVAEDAEVVVQDGYASFSVQEGKTYVISTADLAAEAAPIVKQATASCCDTTATSSSVLSVPLVMAIVVVVVAVAVIATYLVMKKKAGHEEK
jgi:disulfide bond formation protein DsbB